MKKIDKITIDKVIELYNQKIPAEQIAEKTRISRRSVFNIIKKYCSIEKNDIVIFDKKNNINILELISLRLLYYCDDVNLLARLLTNSILDKKAKKIFIPKKIKKVIDSKKINNIIELVQKNKKVVV